MRYQDLAQKYLDQFDAIVHLAAHSSVAACEADPRGALRNNATDLPDFLGKLSDQTFIHASTGSLRDINRKMTYDRTKVLAETAISELRPSAHMLRLGTVCGVSPVMREDVLLNGMTRDAVRDGVVRVCNQGAWRPVLFLSDLCWYVDRILTGDVDPGVHELASFQCRIGGWAEMVAERVDAEVKVVPDTSSYNFRMPVLEDGPGDLETVLSELTTYWRETRP